MLILTILKIIGWIIAGAFGLAILGLAVLGGAMVIGCRFKAKELMKHIEDI